MECKLAPIIHVFSNVIIMLGIAWVLLLVVIKAHHEDAATPDMSVTEMIESFGYPAEYYKKVKTTDGYILSVYRIPFGIRNTKRKNRPVVFLMHGLMSSSYDWVNMGPGFSISYDLADAGYDVWMGNARGNKLSRMHARLSPLINRRKFWSFSWHEIGIYDLPAMIDFVLGKTNQQKLSYIGHSQGTTSFFVMTSMKPKYNNKIKIMVALAPVAYMSNMWNPLLRLVSTGHKPLHLAMTLFGWYEFIPGVQLLNMIGKKVCSAMSLVSSLCASAFFMVGGWDSQEFNKSALPVIMANVPAGAASRQFLHYAQGIKSEQLLIAFNEVVNLFLIMGRKLAAIINVTSDVVIMIGIAWVLLLVVLRAHHENAATPEMSVTEMIESFGYPAEYYRKVKTKDGYLLSMHRIPYGKGNTKRRNRPVVLLMHGLLSSSFDWVNMGPGFSISYDLAEAGFDVWMGNARGNKLSRTHARLSPSFNNKKFWSFSWHEIGVYDLPAMIDFVLGKTDQRKLSYIGHSQGTTSFFVMASMKPKYNDKIKLMVALAPVAYMSNMWNPLLQVVSRAHRPLHLAMTLFGWHEFIPGVKLFNLIGKTVCSTMSLVSAMCASVFFVVGGWDSQQFNKSALPVILANVPAGAASRQFLHYAQGIRSGEFRQYDFGKVQNLITYHSSVPPKYDLKKIRAPISLVFADNDWLSSTKDVQRLKKELSNVVDMYRVPFSKFNHLDYLFAINVKKLVNDHVVDVLLEWK